MKGISNVLVGMERCTNLGRNLSKFKLWKIKKIIETWKVTYN